MYGGFISFLTLVSMLATTASRRVLLRLSHSSAVFFELAVSCLPWIEGHTSAISLSPRSIGVVREVSKPPGHWFWSEAGIRFTPAVNKSMTEIAFRQLQTFIMELRQNRRGCFYLESMFQQQTSISSVIEVSSQQGKCHPKLRGFRAAHVVHAPGVHKIREVIVDDLVRGFKAAPFQIRIGGHCKDVLKAVVFRTVIIPVHGAIFGVYAAWPHHKFFGKCMLGHIGPDVLRKRNRRKIVELSLPIFGENQKPAVEMFRCRIQASGRESGIAVAVDGLDNFAILNENRAMPSLDNELVVCFHISEYQQFVISSIGFLKDLPHRGHPAAQKAVIPLHRHCVVQIREVLPGVIGARAARGINRHSVKTLFRTYECIPAVTPEGIVFASCGTLRRRRQPYHFWIRVPFFQEMVREKVSSRRTDLLQFQAEVWSAGFVEGGFRGLGQDSCHAS